MSQRADRHGESGERGREAFGLQEQRARLRFETSLEQTLDDFFDLFRCLLSQHVGHGKNIHWRCNDSGDQVPLQQFSDEVAIHNATPIGLL